MQNSIVENAMIPKLIYKKHEKVDLFVPAIDTVSVHQNHHDLLVLAQAVPWTHAWLYKLVNKSSAVYTHAYLVSRDMLSSLNANLVCGTRKYAKG